MNAQAGCFYAVGIGPGSADLLTVRAVDIIKSADVIIAPRAETAEKSIALEAIKPYITDQEIIEHIYPMKRDINATLDCWGKVADIICEKTSQNMSVAQITLGDPLIYSTSSYLLDCLEGKLERKRIQVVPGISAFQAAAAKFQEILCLQEDRVTMMPGTDLIEVGKALESCETLLLYKAGRNIEKIKELLLSRGLLKNAKAAFYVEQDQELLWWNMEEDLDHSGKYMTIVIVRNGSRGWK